MAEDNPRGKASGSLFERRYFDTDDLLFMLEWGENYIQRYKDDEDVLEVGSIDEIMADVQPDAKHDLLMLGHDQENPDCCIVTVRIRLREECDDDYCEATFHSNLENLGRLKLQFIDRDKAQLRRAAENMWRNPNVN